MMILARSSLSPDSIVSADGRTASSMSFKNYPCLPVQSNQRGRGTEFIFHHFTPLSYIYGCADSTSPFIKACSGVRTIKKKIKMKLGQSCKSTLFKDDAICPATSRGLSTKAAK